MESSVKAATSGLDVLETQAFTECANNSYFYAVNKHSLFFRVGPLSYEARILTGRT